MTILSYGTFISTINKISGKPRYKKEFHKIMLRIVAQEDKKTRGTLSKSPNIPIDFHSNIIERIYSCHQHFPSDFSKLWERKVAIDIVESEIKKKLSPHIEGKEEAVIVELVKMLSGDDSINMFGNQKRSDYLKNINSYAPEKIIADTLIYTVKTPNNTWAKNVQKERLSTEKGQLRQALIIPQKNHGYQWEADYMGQVWISIHPTEENKEVEHEITIFWGCWVWKTESGFRMPNGVVLTTFKIADAPKAVVLEIQCNHKIYARFGSGDVEEDVRVVDIRRQWKRIE